MPVNDFFASAPADVARWRDIGYGILQAVPKLSYAGHRITLHHLQPAYALPGIRRPLHSHTCYEGIIILSGSARETSGERQKLSPGTLLLTPPDSMHGWETRDSELLRFGVWFTLDTPVELKTDEPYPQNPEVIAEIAALLETARLSAPGWRDCVKARVTLLLATLLQSAKWDDTDAPLMAGVSGRVSEAVDHFLRDNISQPLTLRDIASHCGLSVPTLTRHLRQEGHRGAIATLQAFRMELATELLQNTQVPISAIARQIGIPDASYFNHCFREHFNCSPGYYRNSQSPRARAFH